MPKYTITSGISAIGGSARKKLITGSRKLRRPLYQPRQNPTGTATSTPSATPINTRCVDIHISLPKRPRESSKNLLNTSCGAGTSAKLTRPLARTPYQSASISSQGESTQARCLIALLRFIFLTSLGL